VNRAIEACPVTMATPEYLGRPRIYFGRLVFYSLERRLLRHEHTRATSCSQAYRPRI